MPIYEYLCNNCQAQLEKIQKISDPDLSSCPECSQPSLQKLISATAFRLKGQGWYETDFKTAKEVRRNLAATDEISSSASTQNSNIANKTTNDNTAKKLSSKDSNNGGA